MEPMQHVEWYQPDGPTAKNFVPLPQSPPDLPAATGPVGPAPPPSQQNPYSNSGFNILFFLSLVLLRPSPKVQLGSVDLSCAFVVCDARAQDDPIVYVSDTFEQLTGYTRHMILGRNCRFLQSPDGQLDRGIVRGRTDIDQPAAVLRDQVHCRQEVQIRIVNFRRGGKAFRNLVTVIPIQVRERGLYQDGLQDYLIGFQTNLDTTSAAVSLPDDQGDYSVSYLNDHPIPRLVGNGISKFPNSDMSFPTRPSVSPLSPEKGQDDDVSALLHNLTSDLSRPAQSPNAISGHVWGRILLEQCHHPILVLSASGSVLYAAPATAHLLKYPSASAMVGLPLQRLCHRADIAAIARALRDANPMGVAASTSGTEVTEDEQFTTVDLICRFRRHTVAPPQNPYLWTHSIGSVHSSVTGSTLNPGGSGPGGGGSAIGSRTGWARRHVILSIRPIRTFCLSRSQLAHATFNSPIQALSITSSLLANPSDWPQIQHKHPQPGRHLLYPKRSSNSSGLDSDPSRLMPPTGGPLHPSSSPLSAGHGFGSPTDSFFDTLHVVPSGGIMGLGGDAVESPKSVWIKVSRTGAILFVPSTITLLLNAFGISSPEQSFQPHEYNTLRQLMVGKSIHSLLRPLNGIIPLLLEQKSAASRQAQSQGMAHNQPSSPDEAEKHRQSMIQQQNIELQRLLQVQRETTVPPMELPKAQKDPLAPSNWTGRMNNNFSAITTALDALDKFKQPCLNPPIPCLIRPRWRRSVNIMQESFFDAEEEDVLEENEELRKLFSFPSSQSPPPMAPVVLLTFFAGDDPYDPSSGGGSTDGNRRTYALARIEIPTPASLWAFLSDPTKFPDKVGFTSGQDVMLPSSLSVASPVSNGGTSGASPDSIMTNGAGNPGMIPTAAPGRDLGGLSSPPASSGSSNPGLSPVAGGGGGVPGSGLPDDPTLQPTDNIFSPEITPSNPTSWQYEFGKLKMQNEALMKEAMMLRRRLAAVRSGGVSAAASNGIGGSDSSGNSAISLNGLAQSSVGRESMSATTPTSAPSLSSALASVAGVPAGGLRGDAPDSVMLAVTSTGPGDSVAATSAMNSISGLAPAPIYGSDVSVFGSVPVSALLSHPSHMMGIPASHIGSPASGSGNGDGLGSDLGSASVSGLQSLHPGSYISHPAKPPHQRIPSSQAPGGQNGRVGSSPPRHQHQQNQAQRQFQHQYQQPRTEEQHQMSQHQHQQQQQQQHHQLETGFGHTQFTDLSQFGSQSRLHIQNPVLPATTVGMAYAQAQAQLSHQHQQQQQQQQQQQHQSQNFSHHHQLHSLGGVPFSPFHVPPLQLTHMNVHQIPAQPPVPGSDPTS